MKFPRFPNTVLMSVFLLSTALTAALSSCVTRQPSSTAGQSTHLESDEVVFIKDFDQALQVRRDMIPPDVKLPFQIDRLPAMKNVGQHQRPKSDVQRAIEISELYGIPPPELPPKGGVKDCTERRSGEKLSLMDKVVTWHRRLSPFRNNAWIDIFNNRVSRLLVKKYMECDGNPLLLNTDEMVYLMPAIQGLDTFEEDGERSGKVSVHRSILKHVRKTHPNLEVGRPVPILLRSLNHSGGGNIGNFWAYLRGEFTYRSEIRNPGEGSLEYQEFDFHGKMTWVDREDFHPNPSRVRSESLRVRFADFFLSGQAYDVRSEELPIYVGVKSEFNSRGEPTSISRIFHPGSAYGGSGFPFGYTKWGRRANQIVERFGSGEGFATGAAGAALGAAAAYSAGAASIATLDPSTSIVAGLIAGLLWAASNDCTDADCLAGKVAPD